MKLYLAGPMTGIADFNFPLFNETAARLRAKGHEVINPAEIENKADDWVSCMKQDIRALLDCEAVATLHGWSDSRGAKVEVTLAVGLGMKMVKAADL